MLLSIVLGLVVIYISLKIYRKLTAKFITVQGQCVLVTGCDTGKIYIESWNNYSVLLNKMDPNTLATICHLWTHVLYICNMYRIQYYISL